jgi:signal transduction histidine kinase
MRDDADGKSAGSVIVFNDVTDLVEALEAKDGFLHAVSHELRTPLTSILGYLDLALEEAETLTEAGRLASDLRVAERNAERLLHLVSDLLATASGPTLRVGDTDLSALVASSLASARPQADAAGIVLVDDAAAGVRGVLDPDRIHQVLDNLLSNAIKYSSAGDSVTASCRSADGVLEICVADTGRGMTEEDRLQVFDRFFRTADVQESAIPGLGLGLSITRMIVQAHGGTISVASTEGEGTAFTVRIPAAGKAAA